MKILMLLGSPHGNGPSAQLAESFAKGAVENGHEVVKMDCAKLVVHPCVACEKCHMHGVCVWTDDMPKVEKEAVSCDMIVFVSPIYYAGITAQLKVVFDRFYSFDAKLMERKPKFALITTAHEDVYDSTAGAVVQVEAIARYYGVDMVGKINALDVGNEEKFRSEGYIEKAYELGRSI